MIVSTTLATSLVSIGRDDVTARPGAAAPTTLNLLGGAWCLDFVNTVDPRADGENRDYLSTYADLVAWSRHAGVLSEGVAERLSAEAGRRPAEAEATLARALVLREAIYRVFYELAHGTSPAAADLEVLNRELGRAMAHARITPVSEGFAWDWSGSDDALARVLWPLARSAAELLIAGERLRVRECSGHDCGWLFLDASKNRSRRWCNMESCGNRAKARRHYQRRRRSARSA